MIKGYRRIVTIMMVAILLVPTFGGAVPGQTITNDSPVYSGETASREEVIYANLTATGEIKQINAVNILDVSQAGIITDYGTYTSVKNLTNTEELLQGDNQITVKASVGNFYYQGKMASSNLPWDIDLTYYMDGQEVPPADIGGKNGHLTIRINTTPNTKVDSTFYENYLLQIYLTMDTAKSKNFVTEGGTVANAGRDKIFIYTVMPGKTGKISLSADVTDFSMTGIELSAVPFSMEINKPDTAELTDNMTDLTDAITTLNIGTGKLESGTFDLKNGAADLRNGSFSLNNGLNKLSNNSHNLTDGSREIRDALDTISAYLNGSSEDFDMDVLSQLPVGLSELANALEDITIGLSELKTGFTTAYSALDSTVMAIPDYTISEKELAALYLDNPDVKALIDQLVEFYTMATITKGTYQGVKPAFESIETTLNIVTGSINTISSTLLSISGQVESALEGNDMADNIAELSHGLSKLSIEYRSFHEGLLSYTCGVSELAGSYGSMHEGISGIATGTDELHGGVSDLYNGTTELNNEVKGMPEQVDIEIDKMISEYDNSNYVPVSFVSHLNGKTALVQFIIKTEKIEKPEMLGDTTKNEAEETNFWTRFLDLFR